MKDEAFVQEARLGAKWRAGLCRRILEAMYDEASSQERVFGRTLGTAYAGLVALEAMLSEPAQEFRRASVYAAGVDGIVDYQRDLAKSAGTRDKIMDLLEALSGSTEALRIELRELDRVARLAYDDPGPVGPAPWVPDIAPISGSDPIPGMLDWCKDNWDGQDQIILRLPAGRIQGVAIGAQGWNPLRRYDPWWGDAEMVLRGHASGTTIVAVSSQGFGSSLQIEPHEGWTGRLTLENLVVEASDSHAISGGLYGRPDVEAPLECLTLRDVSIVEVEGRRCFQPISLNQARVHYERVFWSLPNSREHGHYERNGHGERRFIDCHSTGLGGQVIQVVNRPEEGPDYGRGKIVVEGGDFSGFHRDPGRAGSAITLAGSGCDLEIRGLLVMDIGRDESYGGVVVWDGGGPTKFYPPRPNYDVLIEDTDFVFENPNRSTILIDAAGAVTLRRCGVYGRGIEVGSDVTSLRVEDCNTPQTRSRVLKRGIPEHLLVDGMVVFGGEDVGPVSSPFEGSSGG